MIFKISDSQHHIAVALSGGGDSMALAHMMCGWARDTDRQIHLLHINHNLRPESSSEADQVGEWVKNFPNSTYHVLTWEFDDKPDTAIMEKARQARYKLMSDYCQHHGIKTLAVAHHADDQLETFLFRLAKGSGLDGLSGMNEWADLHDIKIYRPLLHEGHNDLIHYCEKNNIKWIEDPSNKDESYARPRIRQALIREGFDSKRFAVTLDRIARGQEALQWMTDQAVDKTVKANRVDYAALKTYPLDIQIRVVQKILTQMGYTNRNYPPKLQRVEEIIETLSPGKSATLFGCVLTLSRDGNSLEIATSNA